MNSIIRQFLGMAMLVIITLTSTLNLRAQTIAEPDRRITVFDAKNGQTTEVFNPNGFHFWQERQKTLGLSPLSAAEITALVEVASKPGTPLHRVFEEGGKTYWDAVGAQNKRLRSAAILAAIKYAAMEKLAKDPAGKQQVESARWVLATAGWSHENDQAKEKLQALTQSHGSWTALAWFYKDVATTNQFVANVVATAQTNAIAEQSLASPLVKKAFKDCLISLGIGDDRCTTWSELADWVKKERKRDLRESYRYAGPAYQLAAFTLRFDPPVMTAAVN